MFDPQAFVSMQSPIVGVSGNCACCCVDGAGSGCGPGSQL